MKTYVAVASLVAWSTSLCAAPTLVDVQPLLAKNACLACHAVDKKLIGPAYQDVARKYAGRRDAATYLTGKIKGGSVGVWGPVAMPPNTGASDVDVKQIVDWLIAGAPAK